MRRRLHPSRLALISTPWFTWVNLLFLSLTLLNNVRVYIKMLLFVCLLINYCYIVSDSFTPDAHEEQVRSISQELAVDHSSIIIDLLTKVRVFLFSLSFSSLFTSAKLYYRHGIITKKLWMIKRMSFIQKLRVLSSTLPLRWPRNTSNQDNGPKRKSTVFFIIIHLFNT